MQLEVKSVTKSFGEKMALNSVSITFSQGVTGLLGPNGAGKSSLMRLMSTIDKPTMGDILWNGKSILKNQKEIRSVLGYLPQDFGVYPNLTAGEFLEYMAAIKGIPSKIAKTQIDNLLEVLHLSDVKKKTLGGFSGGMKQRVGIAQALLNNPEVLIVDEPTVGLDPEERISFRNMIASIAAERIVIISTHIVSDIEAIAPKIAILSKGNLLCNDSPGKLLTEVNGKVWTCTVNPEKFTQLREKYLVSNSMQKSDGIVARVISGSKPALEATLTEPNLEDTYLFVTSSKQEG